MPDIHLFALFMAGALALNVTPGPDMTFVLPPRSASAPAPSST
jgi:threonine/homoserine/homoserine lactone efflux protein